MERLRFVTRKCDATRLHDDLRLETGWNLQILGCGTIAQSADKPLAAEVENHRLAYGNLRGDPEERSMLHGLARR